MCIELFVIFSDDGLNFCGICGDFPFIIFYCIYLVILFSFLLIWLVVYFVDLFEKAAPGFIDFLKGFCVSTSINSALILVISCCLLSFEFFLSCSSSSFNFDDMVSILDLSLFLIWAFISIYFPLETALKVSQRFWYVLYSFSWFQRTYLFMLSFNCLSSHYSGASCSVSMKLCGSQLVS